MEQIITTMHTLTGRDSRYDFAKVEAWLADGQVITMESDLTDILFTAERLSKSRTFTGGHRGFDILHVATALTLGATDFLTFDSNQATLAASEGLSTPLVGNP